jgi:hypothetical protein
MILVLAFGSAPALAAAPSRTAPPTRPPSGTQPARNPREPVAPPPSRSPAAALDHAVRLLTEEARQSLKNGRLSRAKPDFCETFTDELPTGALVRRLTRPINRDPIIDAYVRWQLAGCAAALPEMDDRAFDRFLAQLPRLVENPRANATVMRRMGTVVRAGTLSEADQATLSAELDDVVLRTSRAAALNQAALGLRDWVRDHLPETGPRRVELELDRCAAMIAAGWSVDEPKRRLERMIESAAQSRDVDDAARRRLATRVQRLEGPGRMYVSSAQLVDGALAVQYGAAAVYDFDVRRWQRLLTTR